MMCLRPTAHLDVIAGIQGEAVVDALRKHDHISLLAVDADPFVLGIPHIKISCTKLTPQPRNAIAACDAWNCQRNMALNDMP